MHIHAKNQEEASNQYTTASRPDLAQKELAEASILKSFLPSPLSDEEIVKHLTDAINQETVHLAASPPSSSSSTHSNASIRHPGALQGRVIKAFWNRVEAGTVPADVVAKKAKELLQSHSPPSSST